MPEVQRQESSVGPYYLIVLIQVLSALFFSPNHYQAYMKHNIRPDGFYERTRLPQSV